MASDDDSDVEKQILSQNEIDALLDGVESGDIETEDDSDQGDLEIFKFASQDVLLQKRLPRLEIINDKFAKSLQDSLYNILQRRIVFAFDSVDMIRFGDYMPTLQEPVSLTLVRIEGLHGIGLITIDGLVISGMIERMFGGIGITTISRAAGAEFTAMEERIIERFLSAAYAELLVAWDGVLNFKVEELCHESNPQMVSIASNSDIMVVNRFNFALDDCTGEFQIVMPYSMLEPIRDELDSGVHNEMSEVDSVWTSLMFHELKEVEVNMSSVLVETSISLGDIEQFKEGSIVPFDMPDIVTVFAEDIPIFRARYGVSHNKNSLKLIKRFSRDDVL